MVKGIDISTFQGVVDFAALKGSGSVAFVYAKATEGLHEVDDQYKRNRDVARNRHIPVGAYHFFHPAADPVRQAAHFLATIGQATLLPMVDVEVSEGCSASEIVASLAAFLREVDRTLPLGKRTLIYTGWAFWNDAVGGSDAFAGHPCWVAAYPDSYEDTQAAPVPTGWTRATLWQYSSTGRIPGIAGNVDLDRLEGPLSLIER